MLNNPKIWLPISLLTILASIAIVVIIRPAFGIDFTGGSLLEITTPENTTPVTVRDLLTNEHQLASQVQTTDSGSLIIRTQALDATTHQAILETLRANNSLTEELRFESIGPSIGQELRRKAWLAIGITVAAMILYLAYTFRAAGGLISSWKFGVAAVVALLHDLLIVTALFAVLKPIGATIDTLFVTALLAILGYSVNDTIVLFNRLKDEWLKNRSATLLPTIDTATRATLIRSLNTSLTTLLVLITLLLFGGATLRWFIVALAAGTIAGTYSSIFVAPPVLYALAKRRR